MANKAKRRKARQKADQHLAKIPAAQLIQKGEALLAAGNYREAIKFLKVACKNQPDHQPSRLLLVRAYAGRENQLRRKGLVQEADALQRQIRQYRPDAARMEASDLVMCLQSTALDDAVSLYSRYLVHHPPLPAAEMVLAGALLASSDWQAIDQLPDKALLKVDLPVLKQAALLMNDACWEAALEQLQPISRRSPLAPVKLLCRAMICFYENDDPGMQRALAMIPEAFALHPLVERLKSAPQRLTPLWDGQFVTPQLAQSLLSAVKKKDWAGAARTIKSWSRSLRPQDPRPVVEQLLVALWPLVLGYHLDSYDLAKLTNQLLPGRWGKAIAAKFQFLEFDDYLEDTVNYLELIDEEFPEPADRAVATSMVLSASVQWIVDRGLQDDAVDYLSSESEKLLGVQLSDALCILLEVVLKALELDPQNGQAQDLLGRLPRRSRQAKQLAERGLLAAADNRPDDPAPCLALAKLYFEKNAFRKAEACLKQAEQRAPHDDQVRQAYVLALLNSIDINLKRNKFHLIQTDLEKAEKMCGANTMAQVRARRILFDFEQTGQLPLFDGEVQSGPKDRIRAIIEHHIADLPDATRLQTLGLLVADSRQRFHAWSNSRTACLEAVFKRQAAVLDGLTSKTLRALLLPDTDGLAPDQGRLFWLDIFLRRFKNALKPLSDEDVLPVLETLFEADRAKRCLEEIRRRLKSAIDPFHSLLELYRLTIGYTSGQERLNPGAFMRLFDQVEPQHLELFRAAARRLSKFAREPLKSALEDFRFEQLAEERCNCPACRRRRAMEQEAWWNTEDWDDGDWDEEEEDREDQDFDGGVDELIQSLIDQLEMLIDSVGLRGLPDKALRQRRKDVLKNASVKMMLGALAAMLPPFMANDLSREARYLLFG